MIQAEPGGSAALLNSTLCQYKNLTGVTQAVAEEFYISIAVQLDGYGHETFTAKVNKIKNILL